MKLLNSVRLVSLVPAILLVGCQDADYDFEKNYLNEDAKAFVDAFEERYGYIDPDHTFNDAFYGSVEVTTDESALVTVSAFIDSEKDATILAQAVVDGTQTIEYDYPNGTARVFVIAKSNGMTDGAILVPGKAGKASFTFAETRAEFSSIPPVQTTASLVKYVKGFYNVDENGNIVQSWSKYDTNNTLYNINDWTGRFYSTFTPGDIGGDYTRSAIASDILNDIAAFFKGKENSDYFNEAAQNISFQVTENSPVSLTGVSCTTNSGNAIGYFFTTGDHNTLADFKAADKFILVPNANVGDDFLGRKYYLTYYPSKDSNGNPTGGTRIIPEGTIVHFFLIRGDNWPSVSNGEFYFSADMMWGSEPEITEITAKAYNTSINANEYSELYSDLATTASFTYNGFMCLGFEDWPQVYSKDRDWNDVVFTIEGEITNGETTTTKKMNLFTVAVEDLGAADDQDYNDLVFTVSQDYNIHEDEEGNVSVTYEYPELTLVCAGGTLPLRLYYKHDDGTVTELVSEVHDAFGVASSRMINTGGDGADTESAIVSKDPVTVTFEDDYFLTHPLTMSSHADNFYIEITKKDGTKQTVNANSNDDSNGSHTPFVLVIPTTSWEFPKERVNIDLVYPKFRTWVNSQEEGSFWYDNTETTTTVQATQSQLLKAAAAKNTASIESAASTESTSSETYGENNLSTTVTVGNTYEFENYGFLRQSDLSYKMLLTIENNSKALLDIETVWGSKEEGTVYLKTLSGSVITSITPNMTNTVTFENVSVADILNGFCLQNTNSEIKLQSMTLTCHYKEAESFYLEANGTYNYSYPIPELFEHTNKWGNSTTEQLGYKINFTCGEGVRYVKIETEWAESFYAGVSICALNGQELLWSDSYSNDNKTVTFDKVDLTDLNVTTGFILTGFTDKTKDLLNSVKITVLEEEVENTATVDADGTLVYSNLTAQTITFTDASGNSNTQQGYKIGLSSDDIDAENVSVETTWSSESVTSATITDLDGKEIVSASSSSAKRYGYATANGTKTITFDKVPFASIQNGFFITSSTGSDNLASVKIKAVEDENSSGGNNGALSMGTNTVNYIESGSYHVNDNNNTWEHDVYLYKYCVTLPAGASKLRIISYWNSWNLQIRNASFQILVNVGTTWSDKGYTSYGDTEITDFTPYIDSDGNLTFYLSQAINEPSMYGNTITIEVE